MQVIYLRGDRKKRNERTESTDRKETRIGTKDMKQIPKFLLQAQWAPLAPSSVGSEII